MFGQTWEVPAGPGITGLWRPEAATGRGGGGGRIGIYTLRQNGNALTGVVEGGGGRGGEAPVALENGKVEGAAISFTTGGVDYAGTIKGDTIELQRAAPFAGGAAEAVRKLLGTALARQSDLRRRV